MSGTPISGSLAYSIYTHFTLLTYFLAHLLAWCEISLSFPPLPHDFTIVSSSLFLLLFSILLYSLYIKFFLEVSLFSCLSFPSFIFFCGRIFFYSKKRIRTKWLSFYFILGEDSCLWNGEYIWEGTKESLNNICPVLFPSFHFVASPNTQGSIFGMSSITNLHIQAIH